MMQKLYRLTEPETIESQVSPDGQWRVEVNNFKCTDIGDQTQVALEFLYLVRSSDGTESTIDKQFQYCGGLGTFGLGNIFWSENSRFFYYTTAREGAPDGGCGPWYRPLIRYDMTNTLKQDMGRGLRSPDGKLFASFAGHNLQVWNLNESEGLAFPVPEQIQGYREMAWSPDSQALAYLANETHACRPAATDKTYVVYVNPGLGLWELLIESASPSFRGLAWESSNLLRLSDEKEQTWQYDLTSKELLQAP